MCCCLEIWLCNWNQTPLLRWVMNLLVMRRQQHLRRKNLVSESKFYVVPVEWLSSIFWCYNRWLMAVNLINVIFRHIYVHAARSDPHRHRIIVSIVIVANRHIMWPTVKVQHRNVFDGKFTQIEWMRVTPIDWCRMTIGECLIGKLVLVRVDCQFLHASNEYDTCTNRFHCVRMICGAR